MPKPTATAAMIHFSRDILGHNPPITMDPTQLLFHIEDAMAAENTNEVTAHAAQAREFLGKALEYLEAGDLHQASEKGWGAAAHMAKAVAVAQDWRYDKHRDFHRVMVQAQRLAGGDRIRLLSGRANELHANFYDLRSELDEEEIRRDLADMADLLQRLQPLANLASG